MSTNFEMMDCVENAIILTTYSHTELAISELLFQNKSLCKTLHMKMSLIYLRMNLRGKHFIRSNGFSQRLVNVLTLRCTVTRKWPMEKIKTDSALCSSFL